MGTYPVSPRIVRMSASAVAAFATRALDVLMVALVFTALS